jgi:hypothetical protein
MTSCGDCGSNGFAIEDVYWIRKKKMERIKLSYPLAAT